MCVPSSGQKRESRSLAIDKRRLEDRQSRRQRRQRRSMQRLCERKGVSSLMVRGNCNVHTTRCHKVQFIRHTSGCWTRLCKRHLGLGMGLELVWAVRGETSMPVIDWARLGMPTRSRPLVGRESDRRHK